MTRQRVNGMKISNKYLRLTSREALHLNQVKKRYRERELGGKKKEEEEEERRKKEEGHGT
jgi:hypothetical protein